METVRNKIISPPKSLESLDGLTFDLQRFSADIWDGSIASSFSVKNDNAKTITINSAAELALLAQNVNNGDSYKGWTITLNTDLNLNRYNWTAIGCQTGKNFCGTFDGGGHTISKLKIDQPDDLNQGLFGKIDSYGVVKNVKLDNAYIAGYKSVGGIAGACTASSTIQNCEVSNVDIYGSALPKGDDVTVDHFGGIVGYTYNSTVSSCKVTSSYVFGGNNVGGIVGCSNGGSIKNCTADDVRVVSRVPNGTGEIVNGVYNTEITDNTATNISLYFEDQTNNLANNCKSRFTNSDGQYTLSIYVPNEYTGQTADLSKLGICYSGLAWYEYRNQIKVISIGKGITNIKRNSFFADFGGLQKIDLSEAGDLNFFSTGSVFSGCKEGSVKQIV